MTADGNTLSVRVAIARRGSAARPRDDFALDVAFEAPPGITIIFGPSGSGKSTLLAAIAGLIRPDAGRVALGDDVWFDASKKIDRPIQQRGIAFVFQSLALFPHMTAAANVAYGMPRALPRAERRTRALELLERLKVSHLEGRKPPTFSGGEAQRVALARAFAMSPRIALLDEPFSALDRPLRQGLIADVRDLVDERKIVLLHVTHHRHEARALGDRVVLLEAGQVAKCGSLDDALPAEHGMMVRDMSFDETPIPRKDRARWED